MVEFKYSGGQFEQKLYDSIVAKAREVPAERWECGEMTIANYSISPFETEIEGVRLKVGHYITCGHDNEGVSVLIVEKGDNTLTFEGRVSNSGSKNRQIHKTNLELYDLAEVQFRGLSRRKRSEEHTRFLRDIEEVFS